MSVFDFPRIYIYGTQYVNAGTADNDSLSPGTSATATSDSGRVQPIMNGMSDDEFTKWMQGLDSTGILRAQWNYYGDMSHQWLDVRIVSTQLEYGKLITTPQEDALIGAGVHLNDAVLVDNNPEGFDTSQVFSEALTITAADNPDPDMKAIGDTGTFVSRKPSRATTRWLNWYRNVSFHGILGNATSGGAGGASAMFQSAIEISKSDLVPAGGTGPEYDELLHKMLFNPASQTGMTLTALLENDDDVLGLTLRYTLYLCYPGISDPDLAAQFAAGLQTENPGIGVLSGVIAPWRKGEPKSHTMGRYLKSAQSYVNPYRSDGKPYYLAPVVANVDLKAKYVSVDTCNSFPEDGGFGEKYDMGAMTLGVRAATPPNADPSTNKAEIYTLGVLPNSKESYQASSGIYDVDVSKVDKSVMKMLDDDNCELVITSEVSGTLLSEVEYQVIADSSCNYLDQLPPGKSWDDPDVQKYLAAQPYEGLTGKVPLLLRRRGKVPAGPVDLTFEQYTLTPSYQPNASSTYQYPQLVQRDTVTITDGAGEYTMRPKYAPGVSVYRMVTPGYWPHHISGQQMALQMFENYFFLVRVLPYDDYSEVDDNDLTFDLIYNEIFRYYSLIFPAMNKRLPLNDPSVWKSPTAANYVLKMTDVELWDYFHYMPRTRDLSRYRRELLRRYCNRIINARVAASNEEGNAHVAY